MGEFAPMECKWCGAGPYTGVTLGGDETDRHARSRTYDCESMYGYNGLGHQKMLRPSYECAKQLKAERDRLVQAELRMGERMIHHRTRADRAEAERDALRAAVDALSDIAVGGSTKALQAMALEALEKTNEHS